MKTVKFSDVVTRANTKEDRFNTDKIYYVGGEHIDSNEMKIEKRGIIAGSTIGPMFYCGFKSGDILFVTRNPHLRKCGVVDFDGICSEKTFVLETKNRDVLLQEYLAIVMQSDDFWNYCEENKSGGVNYFLNWSTLAEYEFYLPSLAEQKVLAEKLWAAYEVKQSYLKMISATEEMVKAQFGEMFGSYEKRVKIGDHCSVSSGKSIPTKLEDIKGNIAYVKVADFNLPGNDNYIYNSQRYVAEESAKYSKMIPTGSVIFAKNGAASLSNKKRLTKIDCCIDMNTLAVKSISNDLRDEFLFAVLQSLDISEYVRQGAIPSISPKSIENCQIPYPTLDEQDKYISIAEQADKSISELRKSVDAIDKVIKSLINENL